MWPATVGIASVAMLVLGALIFIELLLRLVAFSRQLLDYDLSDYPFYTRPKNTRGRDHYNVLHRGRKNTPILATSSVGIRTEFPADGKPSILVAGCSFTEGAGLKDEETFPGQLQQFIGKKYTVINAGMGGYGIFQIEQMIRNLLPRKPELVIVQLLDFKRVPLDFQKIAKARKELLASQRLKKWSHLAWYLWKLKPGTASIRSAYMFRNVPKEKLWEENKKYLDGIVTACQSAKVPLLFFIWPVKDQALFHHDYFHQQLKRYISQKNVPIFDARPMLRYYTEAQLQLEHDGHPSALANRLVAKAVKKSVTAILN